MSSHIDPILVQNDPWLSDQREPIQQRIARAQASIENIQAEHRSLTNYANWHENVGIHFDAEQSCWNVVEWAPAAHGIDLIGDFNQWQSGKHPLTPDGEGYWRTTIPAATLHHTALVKLRITGADGSVRDRIPSTIRRAMQDEVTHDYSGQIWQPAAPYLWTNPFDPSSLGAPMIYEAHTGMAGEEPRLHTYREFADDVLPRISKLGYNVVQLMAVQEHPYYGSFGYHVSNFFAASSRFGTPEDLKYLVDTAHGLGIAVIMDIVHSHAVKNLAEGLNEFDGTDHQYFHGGNKGDHPQWDSKCFDYGKEDVRRFLLSNVRYWLEEYRFDGFRFDGITSMLYDHHGSVSFDHYDKYFRDGVDHDAILYLQLATELAKSVRPGVLLVAEDMSGMPGLCRPVQEGGIGFTHRLAMGLPDYWIKLLKHSRDEDWNMQEIWGTLTNRRHGEANIAYAESHDQALVGDKTLAFWLMDQDMYWHMDKASHSLVIDRGIALHKLIRLLTIALGGEGYLTFMGNEFGHPEWLDFPREGNDWSYHYCRRQWSLADNPELRYHFLSDFDKAMIQLAHHYHLLDSPAAEQLWLDNDNKVIAFRRAECVFVFNLHPQTSFTDYTIPIHRDHPYHINLDTDASIFGGHGRQQADLIHTPSLTEQGHAVSLYLPSRSAIVLTPINS